MNKKFLINKKENMIDPFQEKKKGVIEFVERQLNGLNLDYKWISESESMKIDLVDQMVNYYHLQVDNNGGREPQYYNLIGNNWFEKLSQAQNEADVKMIEGYLDRIITSFGVKETRKFREITGKLTELETELKKSEVDTARVNALKNEIIPKFTIKSKNGFDFPDDFYSSPIVYTFLDQKLVEKIESQNRKTNQNQKNNTQYDYSSFQDLEEGKHEIVRKYKELVTKIFKEYYDFDSESTSSRKWSREIKEEYRKVDNKLSQEICGDTCYLENFYSWETESAREHNKKQLKIRARIIEEMEKLIAKAEQGNNDKKHQREEVDNSSDPNKRPRSSNNEEKDFGQLVSEKNEQKDEAINQKIDSILSVAKEENDPQKLASLLKQIEKANGGKDMAESKKNEVRELKEKMFDFNPEQAKQEVISKLNELLSQSSLSKEERDKIAQELKDLDKEENKQEIIKREESITEKIGIAGAQKKLNELISKAKNFLQSNLLNKFQEVKKEVVQFITEQGYNRKAYLTNKSEIDQLFAQTSSEQRPQEPTWKKAIVPVSLLIVATVIVITAAIVTKKRKEKRQK